MRRRPGFFVLGLLLAVGSAWLPLSGQTRATTDNSGVITGVVASSKGSEAGVWVIAEADLQTKFRKIVVTNDQGRFLLPELPPATYKVWVRGYGLADSQPVTGAPGQDLRLTAVLARTPQEAAQVYPANYWYSLMEPPKASEFPGTGPNGNGISPQMHSRSEWIDNMKACVRCHQVGNKTTRTIADGDKGKFDSTMAAWDHRVQRGQRGAEMSSFMTRFGRQRGLQMFADWSDRIAAGAVPQAPPRPGGPERNVVITMWNWSDEYGFVHDEVSTDKRNPRVNPNGLIYGADWGRDYLTVTDPVNNTSQILRVPRRADAPMHVLQTNFQPYRYFGMTPVHTNPANPHNPMFDATGRIWITTSIRGPDNPSWCKEGSDSKYAKYFPLASSGHHAGYYDPKTRKFTLLDTCFGTHHLQFASDANNTLYFSSPGGTVIGWLNTKMYDETGDEKASQGWCPTVLDTNGDGKITKPWNEPASASVGVREIGEETAAAAGGSRASKFDPKLDTRVVVGSYGIIASPDGSVWGTNESYPGKIVRLTPGDNPPETCKSEIFEPPSEFQGMVEDAAGDRPRGIDVDRNGVIWTALAGTSQLASFDRRKCKITNGPATAEGRYCTEGWKLYPMPGPTIKGTNIKSDYHYYNWVDQFNTLGLGENVPIANGTGSDLLIAFKPDTLEWITMRVPYPLGFHSRGMDGRIDDPNAGWKGRAVYATNGSNAVWHTEGGPGVRPTLVKFQIRPDPLSR